MPGIGKKQGVKIRWKRAKETKIWGKKETMRQNLGTRLEGAPPFKISGSPGIPATR